MNISTIGIVSMILVNGLALAGVTVSGPPAGQVKKSKCPTTDGASALNPAKVKHLPPPGADSDVMKELANGDTPFPGWTFKTGAPLTGTIKITQYDSKFAGTHRSGCDMVMEYVKGPGDPANLQFIQMVETSIPLNGGVSPYIDPYPSDDPVAEPLPFYWTKTEMIAHQSQTGITFSDAPRRIHAPTRSVTWRGHLYIASWDGGKTATLHDGIMYGFDAGCVAPGIAALITGSTLEPALIAGMEDVVYVSMNSVVTCTADSLPITPIPNDPALIGYQFYSQAVVFDGSATDPVKVSNALKITIQGTVEPIGVGSGFSLFAFSDPVIGGTIDLQLMEDFHPHGPLPGDTDGKGN